MAPKLEKSNESTYNGDNDEAHQLSANFSDSRSPVKTQSSPLLSSTPPTVSKALVRAYPYLLILNKFLSIITWTNDDYWINVILISVYSLLVLYFENLVTWGGHLIIVSFITLFALLNNKILEETQLHPTLDEVIQTLTNTCLKADRLLDPIISLSLSGYDIKRLLFTTVFLTPIYLIVSYLVIKPRYILLVLGNYLLTYHSNYLKIIRKLLWKLKISRVLFFYLTGLDFLKERNKSVFAAAMAKIQNNNSGLNSLSLELNKPVRFTYVIYENQRRWLGIGWTANLLSYERTPWTDEFLNESASIYEFKLPNPENYQQYSFGADQASALSMNNAHWRWVDKTWKLDLTNDGAVPLSSNKKSKVVADPNSDEGFIYYDNTWKKPSTTDSYSKYTRRRRWIRTAELVFDNGGDGTTTDDADILFSPDFNSVENESNRKKKNLRFAEPEPEEPKPEHTDSKEGSIQEKEKQEVINALDKLEVAPESVSKVVLDPVLTQDEENTTDTDAERIEDIKSVNPISDADTNVDKPTGQFDKKNE